MYILAVDWWSEGRHLHTYKTLEELQKSIDRETYSQPYKVLKELEVSLVIKDI